MRHLILPALLLALSTIVHADIRVTSVTGDVELLRSEAGGPVKLGGGETIENRDRIVTGIESSAQLAFADDSVVVIKEMSDVKVGDFEQGTGAVRTQLWLKAGQVSADLLHRSQAKSDFSVKTPTATCSVRGSGGEVSFLNGETTQEVRHGTFEFRNSQGRSLNGAGQSTHGRHDGSFQNHIERATQRGLTSSLPRGSTGGEHRATHSHGHLSSNGSRPPGNDPGSVGGSENAGRRARDMVRGGNGGNHVNFNRETLMEQVKERVIGSDHGGHITSN